MEEGALHHRIFGGEGWAFYMEVQRLDMKALVLCRERQVVRLTQSRDHEEELEGVGCELASQC